MARFRVEAKNSCNRRNSKKCRLSLAPQGSNISHLPNPAPERKSEKNRTDHSSRFLLLQKYPKSLFSDLTGLLIPGGVPFHHNPEFRTCCGKEKALFEKGQKRNWAGGSVGKKSTCDAGDPGLIPGLGRYPGEGNGNPLQYSCLENSIHRGAWWATVHKMAKHGTQLGG